jgi:hypothetical protein
MKRHAIALLVHPYKDCLLPRKILTERLNDFVTILAESSNTFQNIKVNLALPGSYLELMDPLQLLKLREMHKRNQLEWLFTGYTEPFLSFSLPWLLSENLKYGMTVMNDLAGASPAGLVPPYSNWEPTAIDLFKAAGIQYCVVSKALLSQQYRHLCGFWLTEHMGSSIAFFPAIAIAHTKIAGLLARLEALFSEDTQMISSGKILCIDMLYSLSMPQQNPAGDLAGAFRMLDKVLLSYQTARFTEFLSSHFGLGLNFLPSTLVLRRDDAESRPDFQNEIHTYDQVGILQRKMMDIAENISLSKEIKHLNDIKKTLFGVQDINHYLPSIAGGFQQAADRTWCYSKMIEIEKELFAKEDITGGHIRITDLLRNGNKAIVMSNKNFSIAIDYKNGGQVFGIDYKVRNYNLCAAIGGYRHLRPMIFEAPSSKTAFVDHCLALETKIEDFTQNRYLESGDFVSEDFGYKIKKTATGIKTVLLRNGTLVQGGKNCPLTVEKVLGLEKDFPLLSFVYQLSNHSLTNYSFRFAVESTFQFPGIAEGMARIIQGKTEFKDLETRRISMEQITEWTIEDAAIGLRVHFIMQKPVDVWCFPLFPEKAASIEAQAIAVVISTPVSLDGSKAWSLMGTMECKKTNARKEPVDEI